MITFAPLHPPKSPGNNRTSRGYATKSFAICDVPMKHWNENFSIIRNEINYQFVSMASPMWWLMAREPGHIKSSLDLIFHTRNLKLHNSEINYHGLYYLNNQLYQSLAVLKGLGWGSVGHKCSSNLIFPLCNICITFPFFHLIDMMIKNIDRCGIHCYFHLLFS